MAFFRNSLPFFKKNVLFLGCCGYLISRSGEEGTKKSKSYILIILTRVIREDSKHCIKRTFKVYREITTNLDRFFSVLKRWHDEKRREQKEIKE